MVRYIKVRNHHVPLRGILSVVGGFIVCLAFALDFSYSNLNTYMTAYMRSTGYNPGLTYADFVFVTCTKVVVQGALMPFLGLLAKRLGERLSILVGSLIYCAGIALTYLTIQAYFALAVVTMAFHGVGFGLVYATCIAAAQKWFPAGRRGLVASLVVSGYGFGSLIWIPVQTGFVNPNNLKATLDPDCPLAGTDLEDRCDKYFTDPDILWRVPYLFLLMGSIYLILCLLSVVLISPPPEAFDPEQSPKSDTAEENGKELKVLNCEQSQDDRDEGLTPIQVLRTKSFYLLWICFLNIELTNGILQNYSKTFGLTFINDDHYFAMIGVLANVANGACRWGWGLLYDRLRFRGCYLLMGTIVTVTTATMPILPFVGIDSDLVKACYGMWTGLLFLSFPGIFVIMACVIHDTFGSKYYQSIFGMLFTQKIASYAIILIMKKIPAVQSLLGYTGLFLVAGSVGLLGLLAAFCFRNNSPKKPADKMAATEQS